MDLFLADQSMLKYCYNCQIIQMYGYHSIGTIKLVYTMANLQAIPMKGHNFQSNMPNVDVTLIM